MSQHFRKTILIVCEGARTEPDYFENFRNTIISKDKDIYIKIDPIPKEEREKAEQEELDQQRQGRKRRQIKKPEITFPDLEVEEAYKTQPLYYVRKAQLGLVDSVYDEAWAVYDKDGHVAHQQAFELANTVIQDKKVNIAFNSIAFEYWVLLHFENNTTAFQKSMCRTTLPDDKKQYHFCGTNTHQSDCQGTICVCGRIVSQNYLNYEGNKKEFLFDRYFTNINLAIERAVQLKNSYIGTHLPIYELNPYTTNHRLVFKLLHLPENDFLWFNFDEEQTNDKLVFTLNINNQFINVSLKNIGTAGELVKQETFCLIDIQGNILNCGCREIIRDKQFNFVIDLSQFINFRPILIGHKLRDNQYLISEIPL